MSRPETLQKKYVGKISRRALHFMKILLHMDPAERPCSTACLSSVYFEGLMPPSLSNLSPNPNTSSNYNSNNNTNNNPVTQTQVMFGVEFVSKKIVVLFLNFR